MRMAITLAEGMHMVRRADDDCIDLTIHLGEHAAIVTVFCRIRILLKRIGGSPLVDIAQRDDVLAGHFAQILRTTATGADDRNVEFLIGLVAAC